MQTQRPNPCNPVPRRQRGIAILTVLVIAVLIVTLAAVVFARQSRAVRQSDNFQSLERAWQYAFTMEQYAGLQLQLDALANKYDALTDRWAYELPAQTLTEDSGAVVRFSGKLEDMQGRFNLNNLVSQEGEQRGKLDGAALNQLKPFVANAGLPRLYRRNRRLAGRQRHPARGGRSGTGLLPVRHHALPAADMPFADPSELRLVRLDILDPKLKDKALNQFLQTVTVLPFKKSTLNPNTASKEVLRHRPE
ncbi:MAG: general secretion pathway protein GspK [Candidatus Thiothrix singaporensis]|uniref:General secretion pathway protein GspK n=1 Tax=Candidatus Thiothrix singaporensis TaxID=2799669 RepID=A0A7L6AVG2_9GAMM|nr:MAG: general secretion pathway protein GspK [Candidatus Thiothrix singaporensis]